MPLNYNCRCFLVCVLAGFAFATSLPAQETKSTPDTVDKDYSAELPRIAPLEPADALKSFEIVPGFKLDQVAVEPLVADPVAICFDEDSRMYVVEMRGYSENRDEKLSRIKLLEDTDNDGKYDKATVFAEGFLQWPTAIHCWKGGVYVADAPDMYYLKDTNNDGIADERTVVLTGFGTSNVQGLVNTFQWSLDNRITMAVSSSGAVVTRPKYYNTKPLTIRGRDLAVEPETLEPTPITGGAQHGATTDIWGNRFVCSNSDHIQHCVFEDRHLGRNSYLAVSNARRSIAADGPQADVFRISPLEPWRIVRTRLRVNKIVPGIVEGGGRPSGYFTSATGVTIYNGDAWPEELRGLAFVGDVGSNIVHRKRLKPAGLTFTAERMDEKREFLASRDTWFRPVQFANAPDGCLYICDMYRETIEHPQSIPPILKKHLDLTSGRDRGRIYRVVHEQTKLRKEMPKLSKARAEELVPLLNHPNGWHRETAARLLYERQAGGIADEIERQLSTARPEGFIQSLYTLYGLQRLTAEALTLGLQHENPRVREQAVRLGGLAWSRDHVERIALQSKFIKLVEDPDLRVRFQVAQALSEFAPEVRNPALTAILRKDIGNADMRAAVQSAVPVDAGSLLVEIARDEKLLGQEGAAEFVRSLTTQIGKQHLQSDLATIGPILERWSEQKSPLLAVTLQSLAARQDSPQAEQLAKATGGKSASLLQALLQRAEATALADEQKLKDRISAIEQLRMARWAIIPPVVEKLLTPAQPVELQSAAIALAGNFDSPEVAPLLLARFEQFTPTLKARALDVLVSRPAWALQLLTAVKEKKIPAADIDQTRWKLLGDSNNSDLRTQARKLAFANPPAERIVVLDAYRGILQATGDAVRGKEVFKKNCAACHKLQGFGHELGPNLAAMKARGPEAILVNVLDPNREVNPQFLNYLLLTTDGRSLSGMLTGETATSVTLKKQENATDTVLRVDIESLKSTGQSLMPVGLEKQIDKAAMADLLEYLKTVE